MPFGADTVTVVFRERAKHGEYREVARISYPSCSVQPQGTSEDTDFAQQATNRFKLIAPPGFEARAQDMCYCDTLPGRRLHLDGDVQVWRDRTGRVWHCEAMLTEVEG